MQVNAVGLCRGRSQLKLEFQNTFREQRKLQRKYLPRWNTTIAWRTKKCVYEG
jgi:hypothetical protein